MTLSARGGQKLTCPAFSALPVRGIVMYQSTQMRNELMRPPKKLKISHTNQAIEVDVFVA